MSAAHDPAREYTAWELAGDWWWVDVPLWAVQVGGSVRWETAAVSDGGSGATVRLDRLQILPDNKLRAVQRYVSPDTRFRLVTDNPETGVQP